jgi:hypothetical protein
VQLEELQLPERLERQPLVELLELLEPLAAVPSLVARLELLAVEFWVAALVLAALHRQRAVVPLPAVLERCWQVLVAPASVALQKPAHWHLAS